MSESRERAPASPASSPGPTQEPPTTGERDPAIPELAGGPPGSDIDVLKYTPVEKSRTDSSHRRWAAWKPWTLAGTGAALAAAGGILHWRAGIDSERFDESFKADCPTGCPDTEYSDDLLQRARLERRLGTATLVLGGSALATGVVMAYLNRPYKGERARDDRRWALWKPWVTAGAGAAVAAAGGALLWHADAKASDFDDEFARECTRGCAEFSEADLDRARLEQRLGAAFLIAGGATAVTGLVLAYINGPGSGSGAQSALSASATLTPLITPRATGVSTQLRF